MPRVKSSQQVEALERQRKELLAKLKEAKSEARAAEREARIESAKVAGLAFLDELAESPASDAAQALLSLLDRRLVRKSDRARFGLVEATAPGKHGPGNSGPVEAAIGE